LNSDVGVQNVDNEAPAPKNALLEQPSNVTRIARCVAKRDRNGVPQITFYQSGIGTNDILDKFVGGATGLGLSEHIREAYQFIAANYDKDAGDEIFLVGFSRGSFTARSIAAFINDVGLITPLGMQYFYPIFEDWENQQMKNYQTHFKDVPFHSPRPNLNDREGKTQYVARLQQLGYTTPNVVMKVVACFDTVGSLGIPRIGIFDPNKPAHHSIDYAFVDTSVPPMVQHAVHALALDERRDCFTPTLWELPVPLPGQTLTQVWFQGGHSDVGGSYDDSRAADITLAWMIEQLWQRGLEFDVRLLEAQYWSEHKTLDSKMPVRPWSCGAIHDAMTFFYSLSGAANRSPTGYLRYDHATGEPYANPQRPLQNTCERVHSSVRIRMGLPGVGIGDKGTYTSRALDGWDVRGTAAAPVDPNSVTLASINQGQQTIVWQNGAKTMAEEPLGPLEFELLKRFMPTLEAPFLTIAPGPR